MTTVIRWEKEKGLPVRRAPGAKRSAVFAYTEEIDQWLLLHKDEGPGSSRPQRSQGPQDVVFRPEVSEAVGVRRESAQSWYRSPGLSILLLSLLIGALAVFAFWPERGSHQASGAQQLARRLRFVRVDYEMPEPRGLAVGDFNGDKRIDLIASSTSRREATLLLGDGYGGFSRRLSSATQLGRPEHLAVCDFNGDGKQDIAVTSYFGASEVQILLGNGDGTFREGAQYDVGGRSRWIACGDLNRDGKPDIVVGASTAEKLIVLSGNGDGTFRVTGRYEAERDVAALALADVNGDGWLDVVACDYRNALGHSISVYLNDGTGTLRPRKSYETEIGPLGLAVVDLNHDGLPDLVTANFPRGVSVLLGTPGAGFGPHVDYDAGDGNGFVAIADLDRDGEQDLVVLGEHSNTVTLFFGKGDGTFPEQQVLETAGYPDGAVVADFDGDGKLDIGVINVYGNSLSIFLNRSPGLAGASGN